MLAGGRQGKSGLSTGWRTVAGVVIGVGAALMGVAGGELLIPTIVLLWGVDIKIAGSLSLGSIAGTLVGGLLLGVVQQPAPSLA